MTRIVYLFGFIVVFIDELVLNTTLVVTNVLWVVAGFVLDGLIYVTLLSFLFVEG